MMEGLIVFSIFFLCFPIFINSVVQSDVTREPWIESNATSRYFSENHAVFSKCPKWDLSPEHYLMIDGIAYVEALNATYNSSFYLLSDNNILYICEPKELLTTFQNNKTIITVAKFSTSIKYVSKICLGISMVCILAHLIIFVIVPDMRNLPGFTLASLCLSLFFGYLFYICIISESTKSIPSLCYASAVLTHFFFLSSFFWMSILAFDILLTVFNAAVKRKISTTQFQLKKYICYAFCSWGTTLLFTISSVIADNVEGLPVEYRPNFSDKCWFQQKTSLMVFFAVPLFVMTCLNCICFALSSIILFINRTKPDKESQKAIINGGIMLYLRLGVIMGVTWITGIVATIVNVVWVWYLFVVLNTLQGLFIFLALTLTGKVKNHFRKLLHLQIREDSTPTVFSQSMGKDINDTGKCSESQL